MGYGPSNKDTLTRTLSARNSGKCEYWKIYDVDGFVMTLDVTKCDSVRAAKKKLEQQEPQKTPIDRQVLIDPQGGTLGDQQEVANMPNGCCVNLIRLQQQEVNEDALPTVQLRGLPYQATEEDVKNFFGMHAKNVLDDLVSVRLVLKGDGRPSGFARVTFNTASAASSCQKLIHGKWMGTRYVEVFECPRKTKDLSGNLEAGARQRGLDTGVPACTPEQLAAECKELMRDANTEPVLLSKLGAMLSQEARASVKESGQSLKKFLTSYPDDYLIEGWKGCEYVTYRGTDAKTKIVSSVQDSENQNVETRGIQLCDVVSAEEFVPPNAWGSANGDAACWGFEMNGSMHDMNNELQWAFGGGFQEFNMLSPSWANPPLWPDDCNVNGAGWDVGVQQPIMDSTTMPMNSMSESPEGALPNNESSIELEELTWDWKSDAYLHPQNHPFVDLCQTSNVSGEGAFVTHGEELGTHLPVVRLRGLPFSAMVKDIQDFFVEHDMVGRMLDSPNAIKLLPKANNKPSGQAVVQMASRQDADIAQKTLQGKWIGNRYVEVFSYGGYGSQDSPQARKQTYQQSQHNLSYQPSFDTKTWGSFPLMDQIVCTEPQEFLPTLTDLGDPQVLRERPVNIICVDESNDDCAKMFNPDSPSKIVSQKDTITDVESCNKDLGVLWNRLNEKGTLKVKNTFFDIEDEDSRSKRAVRRLRSI